MKNTKSILIPAFATLLFATSAHAYDFKDAFQDVFEIGAALTIQGVLHETGHTAIAYQVDANNSKMSFFTQKDGNFYFGLNTASGIKENSLVAYRMGGFAFSNITYEVALKGYRDNPTTFNHALALLSATDFFKYSLFALYIGDSNVDEYDPAFFQQEMGMSKEAVLLTALSQALINTYRLYSEDDTVIPFIEFKGNHLQNSINIGFKLNF